MLRRQDLLECAFATWYPRFRHVSPAAVLIDLEPDFVNYLVSDGIVVAPESKAFLTRAEPDEYADCDDYRDWPEEQAETAAAAAPAPTSSSAPADVHATAGTAAAAAAGAPSSPAASAATYAGAGPVPSSSEEEDSEEEGDPSLSVPSYVATMSAIQEAVERLGGSCVPKLNWSCPRDATWVNPCNSLACTNADEVLLMLRSSDRVAHDVCHAFDACTDDAAPSTSGSAVQQQQQGSVRYTLALRKWYDLRPERELRAFVRRQQLVGICQRHVTDFFPQLQGCQQQLREAVIDFHDRHVDGRFPLHDFTYDVYVATTGQVRLLDFNPAGGTTSPLLFDWEELGFAGSSGSGGHDVGGAGTSADSGSSAPRPSGSSTSGGPTGNEPSSSSRTTAERPPAAAAAGRQPPAAAGDSTCRGGGRADCCPTGTSEGEAGAGYPLFRVIDEPVGIRPDKAVYGVPYDFVDTAPGGAAEDVWEKLRNLQQRMERMQADG